MYGYYYYHFFENPVHKLKIVIFLSQNKRKILLNYLSFSYENHKYFLENQNEDFFWYTFESLFEQFKL